jgi:uncharacterized Tic20 family protein
LSIFIFHQFWRFWIWFFCFFNLTLILIFRYQCFRKEPIIIQICFLIWFFYSWTFFASIYPLLFRILTLIKKIESQRISLRNNIEFWKY